jgi:hypothetical protein
VGSNPAVYWMDVSDLLAITLKKIENKGSQMGHTKKNIKKWMWSGASVAHTTPMREDLGSILTQTQDGI